MSVESTECGLCDSREELRKEPCLLSPPAVADRLRGQTEGLAHYNRLHLGSTLQIRETPPQLLRH